MRERFVSAVDGSMTYVTIDGDMVDLIARFYYGVHARNSEAVYEANPGLADRGPILPAGLAIRMPPPAKSATPAPFRKLWD